MFTPQGKGWGNWWSVLHGQFTVVQRHGVHRGIVINSSPRGGAIMESIYRLLHSPPCLILIQALLSPTPSVVGSHHARQFPCEEPCLNWNCMEKQVVHASIYNNESCRVKIQGCSATLFIVNVTQCPAYASNMHDVTHQVLQMRLVLIHGLT
jgi:hypothetical protein